MFPLGNWRNFTELEESLTLGELFLLQGSIYEARAAEQRFQARLQGHEIKEPWKIDESNPDIMDGMDGLFAVKTE